MNTNNPEEERESKERLREELGVDPDELLDTVGRFTELYQKFVLLQFPLTAELKEALKELFEKQYPLIKPYIQIWHVNWIFEAMEGVANTMSIRLVDFFDKLVKDEDYKKGYENYDKLIELYTKPYEAHKTVRDYSKLQLSAEQIQQIEQMFEENYQEDIAGYEELNSMRNEFLGVVNDITLSYFDTEYQELTPEQMVHYNIITGMGYEEYFEECKELDYYLIKQNMQEYPCMNYHEFIINSLKSSTQL